LFCSFILSVIHGVFRVDRDTIRNAITGFSPKGYVVLNFRIASPDRSFTLEICSKAFQLIFNLSKSSFSNFIKQIKGGNLNGDRRFNDMTKVPQEELILAQNMILLDASTGLPSDKGLTKEQKASMLLKNSPIQLKAYAFLENYFNLIGDYQPNSSEEIHLDPVEKKKIYEEYYKAVTDPEQGGNCFDVLAYNSFLDLWAKCFP
jgi:hypothetical protein